LPFQPPGWQVMNIRLVALSISITVAIFYGYLAGFSIPTARAITMLLLYWLSRLLHIKLSVKRWLLVTTCLLILLFPFSLLSASFWLSLYAVCIIFLILWRFKSWLFLGNKLVTFLKSLLLIQVFLTLLLLPLTALFFTKLSTVSILANIVAIPWMSFIVLPLTLLSVILMPINDSVAIYLMTASDLSLQMLWRWLLMLSEPSWALFALSNAQVSVIFFSVTLFAIVIFVLPKELITRTNLTFKGISTKLIKVMFLASLVLLLGSSNAIQSKKAIALPHSGLPRVTSVIKSNKPTWRLHFFDVGHGLSVLLTREGRAILYDTGASYASGFNMVDAVILPYLQYLGIQRLDSVFISHGDNDHLGGYAKLKQAIKVKQLITNETRLVDSSIKYQACSQGMSINWQGLIIDVLWPIKGASAHVLTSVQKQGNDDSCVLLISDGQHKVLLTGDISAKVETKLLDLYPDLTVDVMTVPHHGSKTSSSKAFIKQLSPDIALVSTGYLNRWHMPVSSVVSRYNEENVKLLNTATLGQIILTFTDDGVVSHNYQQNLRPFWFNRAWLTKR